LRDSDLDTGFHMRESEQRIFGSTHKLNEAIT